RGIQRFDRRPEYNSERHYRRVARLSRDRDREGQAHHGLQRGSAEGRARRTPRRRIGHLQRRQLHQRVAHGGREARPPNLKTCVDALPVMVEPESRELFRKYGIFNEEELKSNYHVMLENYCKTVNIEALLASDIARTLILPAALRYQGEIAETISK